MKLKTEIITKDIIIIGAGMGGLTCAIQAARLGIKVALITDRSFLGGNASPEIRITVSGADGSSQYHFYNRESGIIEEIRLENLHKNPSGNPYIWHSVLFDFINQEDNINVYFDTYIDEVELHDNNIISVSGSQSGSETRYLFKGQYFVDDTGDGTIGYLSNCNYSFGREAKETYNEKIAPDEKDNVTLLSTLSFYTKDTKRKVKFHLPKFASNMALNEIEKYREIPERVEGDSRWENYRMQWFYELGYEKDPIKDNQEITLEHRELIYSIFDVIKNSKRYDSETYDFEYISPVIGKRESRRLNGLYTIDENDLVNQTEFYDSIGFGGWSIDLHSNEGIFSKDLINRHYLLDGIYSIPLRSCISKEVNNLCFASRCLSASHVAHGSLRVMATLAVIGQAVGCTIANTINNKTDLLTVLNNGIRDVQNLLIENDQSIIGIKEENSLLKNAVIKASSTQLLNIYKEDLILNCDKNYQIIVPYDGLFDEINLTIFAEKETNISYKLYVQDKKENYHLDKMIFNKTIKVEKGKSLLPIELNVESKYEKVNIVIEKNKNIKLYCSNDNLNGLMLLEETENKMQTYYDSKTLKPLETFYKQVFASPTISLNKRDKIYQVKNIINGYDRNYGLPNLWISEQEDKAFIVIKLEEIIEFSKIKLVFDSSLNFIYDNLEIFHSKNVIDTIVKDYDVEILKDNQIQEIINIRDNYQRINFLKGNFNCNEIRIKFISTNGSSRFSLYSLNLYK